MNAAGVGQFAGTYRISEFAVENNALVARGILVGTLTDATGLGLGTVVKSVTIPVNAATSPAAAVKTRGNLAVEANAVCPILSLDLGPLNLDLLGLTVDLAPVILDIAAETGAGNLLGNLLCAVTGLLDGAGALVDIAQLLNRILGLLGGLLG